jgi:DNA-directed RNA polymerase subunit RPC12/RpoP
MTSFGDTIIPLTCPNPKCKKDLTSKVSDIISRGRFKCSRCGSEILLNSSAVSNLRSAVSELDRAKDKIAKVMGNIMSNAQFNIKT